MSLKYDNHKPRMELLSATAMVKIAEVLGYGSKKYTTQTESGDHNWRHPGFKWSRLYGAALRHLLAHMDGEDTDPESGLSHIAHAGCCIMFLLEHEAKHLGEDDRDISHQCEEDKIKYYNDLGQQITESINHLTIQSECDTVNNIGDTDAREMLEYIYKD